MSENGTAFVRQLIPEFFQRVESGALEIYNEASLQFELGIHLRQSIGSPLRVQKKSDRALEVDSCWPKLLKKEIDLSIFLPDKTRAIAVELKFPRNGQYPEQMYKACQDIAFLEQLVDRGI